METHAAAIKARGRHHKWAMVQATATVMYRKGSSFYNSIINKDGPQMLARWRDNNKRQFESPPSSNTPVSLRRISFFLEIHSPWSITPFFCQNAPFPPKSNKTAPVVKPLLASHGRNEVLSSCKTMFLQWKTWISSEKVRWRKRTNNKKMLTKHKKWEAHILTNSTLTFFCDEDNEFQVKEQGDEKGKDVLKD